MKKIAFCLLVIVAISFISGVYAIEMTLTARTTDEGTVNTTTNAEVRARERIEQRFEGQQRIQAAIKEKEREKRIRVEGKNITISDLTPEQKAIIAGRINAKTGLNLTTEDIGNGTLGSILRVYLSNGRKADVKIMPDRASATALKRLRTKCENDNCTIELKEVGNGNKTRIAYEVRTEKDSRVFLIFNKKMVVAADVDAETGTIISVHKPWWSFIAKEKHDSDVDIDAQVNASASA
ncbi:hypothetical protein KW805_00210 [Candidatus Pacearchaeota archaeon]|nr:hypothetical protein [Candidatus Pacearchaeota archaeon]